MRFHCDISALLASAAAFAFVAAYLLAAFDWAPKASANGAPSSLRRRVGISFKRHKPCLFAHAAFHATVVALAFAIGASAELRDISVFYLMNAVAMFWVLPAGDAWGRSIGSPAPHEIVRRRNAMRRVLEFLALFLGAAALSCALMLFSQWAPDPALSKRIPKEGNAAMLAFLAYVMISTPISEETIFRQYLLCRLIALFRSTEKTRALPMALAVAVTTLLFAAMHTDMIEPAWVKWTQIAILGTALAICQLRHGLASAILLHFLLNAASVALALIAKLG